MPRARHLQRSLESLTQRSKSEWHSSTLRHGPFEPSFHAAASKSNRSAPRTRQFSSSNVVKSMVDRIVYGAEEPYKPKPPALSTFHSSMVASFRKARGGDYAITLERPDDERMRPDYSILNSDGSIEDVTRPIKKQDLCTQFGLNPRDLRVLDGNAPASFAPTMLVRSKSIVYSSSVLRAIITPNAIHVFGASQQDDGRLKAHEIAELLKITLGDFGEAKKSLYNTELPFELRALESVLFRLTDGYRTAVKSLRKQTEELLESLQNSEGTENSMHEAIRDVSDTRHCIDDFLLRARGLQSVLASLLREDEQDLANMYLTAKVHDKARSANDHAEAELLLEGILRRQDETVVTAEGLASQITNAERALELGLDATRNSLIYLEIKLDIVILGLTSVSAAYACFGMNLTSGMEEHPNAFYYTILATLGVGLLFVRGGFRALSTAKRSKMRLMGRSIHQRLPGSTRGVTTPRGEM